MKRLIAVFLIATALLSLGACAKNPIKTPQATQQVDPSVRDTTGWFSTETLVRYSAAGLIQPNGTEIADRPSATSVYLSGDLKKAFPELVKSSFYALRIGNDTLYTPVSGKTADGTNGIAEFKKLPSIVAKDIYPKTDTDSVSLVYKSFKNIYMCSIYISESADTGIKLLCISLSDITKTCNTATFEI